MILLPANTKQPHVCECGTPCQDGAAYCDACASIIAAIPVSVDALTDALIRRDCIARLSRR
jgi:hypothetical protein